MVCPHAADRSAARAAGVVAGEGTALGVVLRAARRLPVVGLVVWLVVGLVGLVVWLQLVVLVVELVAGHAVQQFVVRELVEFVRLLVEFV